MARLSEDMISVIKKEMTGLEGTTAKTKALALARQFGCDWTRIYHHSRDVRPRRKTRADRGDLRAFSEDSFKNLAFYTVNFDMSAPHLQEIYAANNGGEIIAPATYNRHLRGHGISRRNNKTDLKPYISWEAPYPNSLHQVDSTVAQQFYIDVDGSVGFESHLQRYKNKPGNKKPRLHLLGLVDDNSRVCYARFTVGNHTYAWMDFLYHAWAQKEDSGGFPFHGLPKFLYSDNDSVVKSKKFVRAMKLLDVRLMSHEVGNPRAKGKVEVMFKYLQEFEKVTKFGGWQSVEQANEALFDYLYYKNNIVHSSTKEIPFKRWQRVGQKLRAAPNAEIFRMLHMDSDHRQIRKDLTISLNGRLWQLPFREPFVNFVNQSVELYWHPQVEDVIYMILDNKEYEVPYHGKKMHGLGKHEELPEPQALKNRKKFEEAADPDWQLYGFYKDRHRKVYLPQPGEQFDDSRIAAHSEGVMRSKLWFITRLQQEFIIHTPPLPHQKSWVDEYWGEAKDKPESELRKTIALLIEDDSALRQKQATG